MSTAVRGLRADPIPTAPPTRRLRVGVLLSGRLVEERLFSQDRGLSIGASARADVILPGLSPRLRLFEQRRGRLVLRLPPGAIADVVDPGPEVRRLRAEDSGALLLGPRARGRVDLGSVKLLFQLVSVGPPQPRPRLPPSLRGSWWQAFDAFLAALIATYLLAQTAVVLYLRTVDWPARLGWEELPVRWIKHPPRRALLPPSVADLAPQEPPSARRAPSPRRAPAPRNPSQVPTPSGPISPERRTALEAQARRMGINQVLGHLGESGALADLLRAGAPDRDQAAALAQVTGVSSATEELGLRQLLRTPAAGRISGVEGLRGSGAIAESTSMVGPAERSVQRIVRMEPPVVDGAADPALLAKEVRSRLSALRACYERALKRDPRLAGKLVLRFTVTPAGTVTGAEIDEDTLRDEELRACLLASVRRWRCPAPPGPVEVSFPFVFQTGG